MNKIFMLACLLFIMPSAVKSQELKPDDILLNYYRASSLDKLQKITTVVSSGTIVKQDRMPIKIIRMRPGKFLQVFDVADITCYSGYDGTTAWTRVPYTGNPRPQVMPDDAAKDIRIKADFDGLLFQWKAKGEQVELAGQDTIGNDLAYKLKLTRQDGGIEYYSIAQKSSLLLKREYVRTIRGKEVKMEVFYRDYKEVEGILFAFTIENQMAGQPYNTIAFDSIVLNEKVDIKLFDMPSR
jgi:hypothetical protein